MLSKPFVHITWTGHATNVHKNAALSSIVAPHLYLEFVFNLFASITPTFSHVGNNPYVSVVERYLKHIDLIAVHLIPVDFDRQSIIGKGQYEEIKYFQSRPRTTNIFIPIIAEGLTTPMMHSIRSACSGQEMFKEGNIPVYTSADMSILNSLENTWTMYAKVDLPYNTRVPSLKTTLYQVFRHYFDESRKFYSKAPTRQEAYQTFAAIARENRIKVSSTTLRDFKQWYYSALQNHPANRVIRKYLAAFNLRYENVKGESIFAANPDDVFIINTKSPRAERIIFSDPF